MRIPSPPSYAPKRLHRCSDPHRSKPVDAFTDEIEPIEQRPAGHGGKSTETSLMPPLERLRQSCAREVALMCLRRTLRRGGRVAARMRRQPKGFVDKLRTVVRTRYAAGEPSGKAWHQRADVDRASGRPGIVLPRLLLSRSALIAPTSTEPGTKRRHAFPRR